jgi:hypothetical protein
MSQRSEQRQSEEDWRTAPGAGEEKPRAWLVRLISIAVALLCVGALIYFVWPLFR